MGPEAENQGRGSSVELGRKAQALMRQVSVRWTPSPSSGQLLVVSLGVPEPGFPSFRHPKEQRGGLTPNGPLTLTHPS